MDELRPGIRRFFVELLGGRECEWILAQQVEGEHGRGKDVRSCVRNVPAAPLFGRQKGSTRERRIRDRASAAVALLEEARVAEVGDADVRANALGVDVNAARPECPVDDAARMGCLEDLEDLADSRDRGFTGKRAAPRAP